MRLLRLDSRGEVSLTTDLIKDIPPYAILSHTWGADNDEVNFDDLQRKSGKSKVGYAKIRFCGEQARQDDLQYIWLDTCCINKPNHSELSEALNSMFRWYRDAARCYVYLSDVSAPKRNSNDRSQSSWISAFRRSRWFTRGWTLQELLAPESVEFFSREGKCLGDKKTLEGQIHEVTDVPIAALRGAPLATFSIDERLRWAGKRETERGEDKAYCLLGIFNVFMPPIYGEGENALVRLREEINKQASVQMDKGENECIQHLRLTDPRDDKKRIEDIKGGLLEDSYQWVLKNPSFQQWRNDQRSRLLWIKGDPGKGKTMLLCGIINELEKSIVKTDLLSYFFCQATDSRINSATAVLRGLLYLLIVQQPSLISHVKNKHDRAGKSLFADANAWVALSEIFTNILQDPSLNSTYLIIDALDECTENLPKLLDFVIEKSSMSPIIKWLVSSRNWPDIEERLERAGHKVRLSLELNAESVSTAVSIFIRHKVHQLAQERKYSKTTRDAVMKHLVLNANDTFLWVALVCQNLKQIRRWKVLAKLNSFPPGLDSLYDRMVEQIYDSDDADLCKRILASTAIVYRPVTLKEVISLVKTLEDMSDDLQSLGEIIGLCGSFLTIREGTIYFVHQSAKDYLFEKAFDKIFPYGREEAHYVVFSRSLQVLSRTLRRDIYNLRAPGFPIDSVKPLPSDPLAALRYSCIYWVDHLCDWNPQFADHKIGLHAGGVVDVFMRKKYLYWIEALSLCKSMSKGLLSMAKLDTLIQGRADASTLIELVRDARRFIMYHKWAIENSPLQAYASALVFSPTCSLIRGLFVKEQPKFITIKPAMRDEWSACLQPLEGHSDLVSSVVFSHDSTRLASASYDKTVKIWDAGSGECLQTLEGHSDLVSSVVFSHDSTRLASASYDRTVKIWDADSGECLQTLKGHSAIVSSVAFSHDSTRLALASDDRTFKIWEAGSGECLQTLKGHSDWVSSVVFSQDSTRLTSASRDSMVKIWEAGSSECLQTLKGHSDLVSSVVFSHDSTRLASASRDSMVKIWEAGSGECLQTLKGHSSWVSSVVFSHDSTRLASASASDDRTVKIWDADSGECLQTLKGHSAMVSSVVFSYNSTRLASASYDRTVKIWDAGTGECLQTLDIGRNLVDISFDTTGSYLRTEIGTIAIDISFALKMRPTITDPQKPRYHGGALSSDGAWITYNSNNLVWLPSEYRPSCSAVSGKTIGIGVGSGKVWICNFEVDDSDEPGFPSKKD